MLVSALELSERIIVVRMTPSLPPSTPSSCHYRIHTTDLASPACQEVAVLQYNDPNRPECLHISSSVSTEGGRSEWSQAIPVTRVPSVVRVRSVSVREDSETLRASLQLVTDSSDDCQWRIGETSQVIRDSGDHHTFCSTHERSITASLASWQCEDLSTVSVRCSNKFAMDNVIPELQLRDISSNI